MVLTAWPWQLDSFFKKSYLPGEKPLDEAAAFSFSARFSGSSASTNIPLFTPKAGLLTTASGIFRFPPAS
ncbi:MAG: hypothetical protein ACFB21_05775 [Opitutales bacterium]